MAGDLDTADAALDRRRHRRRRGRRRDPPHPRQVRVLHVRLRAGADRKRRGAGRSCSPESATGRCSTSSRCRACWPTARGAGSTGCGSSCGARARPPRSRTPSSTATSARPSTCSTGKRRTREVIGLARDLQATARRSGALRAAAFASALIGEAALLSGDLELARAELTEASELHRDLGSAGGQAHSLQRLAEVRIAEGNRIEAMGLVQQALPLARSSMIAKHLLQRVFGTMIKRRGAPSKPASSSIAPSRPSGGTMRAPSVRSCSRCRRRSRVHVQVT